MICNFDLVWKFNKMIASGATMITDFTIFVCNKFELC